VLTLYGPNVYPLARLGYCYALWGKKAEAEEILDQLKKNADLGMFHTLSPKFTKHSAAKRKRSDGWKRHMKSVPPK
jgi:hypothetical protein